MKAWNPFSKIDMEVGSFLKSSRFNKLYIKKENDNGAIKVNDKLNNENSTKS